jgi:HAMP domain-containing protein
MLLISSFKNVKLGTKFNLLLMLVFIIGISLSGAVLSTVLQQRAQDEVSSRAQIIIQTINSIRNYTQEQVNPFLAPRLETEPEFIPQAIPTFSAREVFEDFRKNEEYKNFFYKDAAPNPTNLRDKADHFETELVEYFRNHPDIKEVSDFRTLPEGKVFYMARPFAITKQQCLQCHSTPAIAPKSLVENYGPENGFGWKLNDIVAAQIISVPAEEVFKSAHRSFSLVMGVLIGIFALVVLLVNFLLKRTVLQRIRKIAKTAQEVSTGKLISADFEETSTDEIGALALAFKRMKSSLEIAQKLINQKKN